MTGEVRAPVPPWETCTETGRQEKRKHSMQVFFKACVYVCMYVCISDFLIILKTHTEKDTNKQGEATEV